MWHDEIITLLLLLQLYLGKYLANDVLLYFVYTWLIIFCVYFLYICIIYMIDQCTNEGRYIAHINFLYFFYRYCGFTCSGLLTFERNLHQQVMCFYFRNVVTSTPSKHGDLSLESDAGLLATCCCLVESWQVGTTLRKFAYCLDSLVLGFCPRLLTIT